MSGIFPSGGVPAGQALNTVNVDTTNCAAGAGELFHSTSRCTPRFDPASANAVMSEILNVMVCADLPYNCNVLTNLCTAIRNIWGDQWLECFTRTLPTLDNVCGTVRYVVLVNDGVCTRFATYSTSDPVRGRGNVTAAQPLLAVNNSYTFPDDFVNPTNYYDLTGIQAAVLANTVNESRIVNSLLTSGSIILPCETRLTFETEVGTIQPPLVQDAYGSRMRVGFRWRENGGVWQYPIGTTLFSPGLARNAVDAANFFEEQIARTYAAGTLDFQTFYIAEQAAATFPPTKLRVNNASNISAIPRTLANPAI